MKNTSWGFTDKNDAETLKRVARERRVKGIYSTDVSSPENRLAAGGSVIVHLDEDLPAATIDDEGTVTLGVAQGYVYRRDNRQDEQSSMNPFKLINSNELMPARDEHQKCVMVRVFNSTLTPYDACSYVECVNDRFGDLYVSSDALSTDLTTTTAHPAQDPICGGECKYVWSASSESWTLDTDNCNTTTSTTTTTTTTADPSTTTTPECVCGNPSIPNTTTTTEPDCGCTYPTICGISDGDCTWTDCGDQNYDYPEADCTTTTSTTTTTCDCNTTTTSTTTQGPGCTEGCDWVSVPTRGWVLVNNGCSPTCPCALPEGTPSICTTEHTPCVLTPTPGTSEPFCNGGCIWWYSTDLGWFLIENNCSSFGVDSCVCFPPSDPGDECGPRQTECVSRTTTTSEPTTTTTQGPCEHCYTTSTTSTTEDPCSSGCIWRWDTGESDWVLELDECSLDCPCYPPAYTGAEDCELRETPCGTATTTTTTTENPCDWSSVPGDPNNVGACCFGPTPSDCVDAAFQAPCEAQGGTWFDCILCSNVDTSTCVTTTTTTTTTTCNPAETCSTFPICNLRIGAGNILEAYQPCQTDFGVNDWDQNCCTCYQCNGETPVTVGDSFPGTIGAIINATCYETGGSPPVCTTTTTTTSTTTTTTTTTTTAEPGFGACCDSMGSCHDEYATEMDCANVFDPYTWFPGVGCDPNPCSPP